MVKFVKIVSFNAQAYRPSNIEKFTKRERIIYYNTKVRQWRDIWEIEESLGTLYKGRVIIPDCYKALYASVKARMIKEWERDNRSTYCKKESKVSFNACRYDVLKDFGDLLPDTIFYDSFGEDECEELKTPVKKVRYDHFSDLLNFVKDLRFGVASVPIRNAIYLQRLRDIINELRFKRSSKDRQFYLKEKILLNSYKLEAQMDSMSAQGEKVCPEIVSQGNTLQESQRGASQGSPAKFVNRIKKYFNRLASAESSPDYAALTDRFFPHNTYEWKGGAEHPSGKNILSLKLPYDFIANHQNAPNCTLFNSYSYWDGDIEVKIMVNSNKFQIGQLQMSWYYGQDYEENFNRRDNIYTASQQAHCLVSASTSNEGTLYIPFRYYKPKMGCKARDDDPGFLNMGNLSVRVINELSCPSSVYKACTFTISFRFVNSNFSGMVSRDLGHINLEPNMFAVRAAMKVLEEMGQDPQRDNPPVVSPPTSMVPWSAHSWSFGDIVAEPINAMRLAAPGQTPHPAEVTPEFDEMSMRHVVSVFGLLNIKKWSASDRTGTLLFSYDGCPVQSDQVYYRDIYDGSNCYAMPPVAVVSNLFAYWRGSLELRLDVIASPFHTGRLLLAYIPRVMDAPTIEQAKGSPHMIIDLQGENRQFVFKVPYIADRPWWHNKSFGNSVLPPSRIYCFVLNELVPMDNVVNIIDINVYMRGCDDFEVSVPVSPRIGLSSYNAIVKYPFPDLMYTRDGYTPVYIGAWRYFEKSKKKILRYGNVTDHITQFENLSKKVIYEQDNSSNGGFIYFRRGDGSLCKDWWLVGIDVDKVDNKCKYAAFFTNVTLATKFALTNNNDNAEDYSEDSEWFVDVNGKIWDSKIYFKPLKKITTRSQTISATFEKIEMEAQMDERSSVVTSCQVGILDEIQSTQSGLMTFGETFDNLKTLCRRYQLYTMIDKDISSKLGHQALKIPILPQGLPRISDEITQNDYYNVSREGIIPIVASAYRFYRGGLRFRFVWRGEPVTLRIEHRPDERLEDLGITCYTDHRSVYNDGYAIVVQNTSVNNVIELEIPFYQCGILGLLQNPKLKKDLESYHFGLGNLYVSVLTKKPTVSFNMDVFYSLADDCRFSVFQGFPMMMWAPNFRLEAQMGLFGDVTGFWSSAKETSEKVNKLVDKVDNALPEIQEQQMSLLSWITTHVPKHLAGAMVNGISQIFHCFINPTVKTVVWALTSFLASIGVLCTNVIFQFSEGLTRLMNIFRKKSDQSSEGKQETASEVTLEAQMDEHQKDLIAVKAGIISTVITSICAAFGAIKRVPSNAPDFLRGIWNNIGKFSLTSNALCTFFKNNLMWITDCYKWVMAKICPSRSLATELEGSDIEMKEFAREALELTSAVNERKVEIHPRWNLRVYKCAAMASLLYMRMSGAEQAPKTPALFNLMTSILKLRDKLVRFQLSPPVRFEPYVMCFAGGSNIGKSHLCQEISKHMLKDIKYKTYQELIYTRTPGNPYWNQLRSQPVCLYDDFCAIGGEHGLQQAAELFCLKSRAIFNPPQADISDKHIRYNPLIVLLATNQAFPKVAGVENREAFHRRRDILVDVVKNEDFYRKHKVDLNTGSPKDFPVKAIKNFEHLLFKIADDVKSEDTRYSCAYSYEDFVKEVVKRFRVFYEREMVLYTRSLDEVFEFYPDETDDVLTFQSVMLKQEKKIDQLNKYRFSSIEELRVLCMSIAATIKSDNDEQIGILFSLLRTFAIYDRRTVRIIINESSILTKYCSSRPDLRDWYHISVGKPGPDDLEASTSMEANMREEECIYICPHTVFSDECRFMDGMFYNPLTHTSFRQEPCPKEVCCPWQDKEKFEEDMEMWKNAKYMYEKDNAFKKGLWDQLPTYFKPKVVPQLNNEAIEKDVESWTTWSKNVLTRFGGGLWTALKWAGEILAIITGIYCLGRMFVNQVFPEVVELKTAKLKLNNDIYLQESYQKELGKKDADLLIQKELIMNKHWTQADDLFTEEEANMTASGDFKTFGKQQPKIVKDVAVKMIANMSYEKESAILRLLKRNSIYLEAVVDNKVIIGRIVGLIDHYAVCVDHYNDKFSKLPGDKQITIIGNNYRIITTYDKLCYTQFKNSSLGYVKLPLQIPPFRNLLKHIARQRDHRVVGPVSMLVEPDPVSNSATVSEQYCERIHNIEIPSSNGFEKFQVSDGYKYARGGRGLCGSVLVSNHLEHPVYGIHVAGDVGGRVGIAEAITYEQFEHLIPKSVIQDVFEGNMMDYNGKFLRPNSHHCMLGVVPYVFGQNESGKTKVIPTECNGEIFPIYCEPPILSPKDERMKNDIYDPLQAGIDKHGLVPLDFPQEMVEMAYHDLNNVILAKVKPIRSSVGKLPKSVAVVGDINYPDYEKLDFNTSEGFPYIACRPIGKKSKIWMLNLEETKLGYNYLGCDQMLTDIMKCKKQQRLNRLLPFTVFTDCLKDRKLPIEKVYTPGKVRIFSISPLDFTIQCRQYFMDFSIAYKSARIPSEHAIGIDVNSVEWSDVVYTLLSKGNNIITADYSNYGPTLMLLCVEYCVKIIRNWYKYNGDKNGDNDLTREIMGYEMIHCAHLARRTVYRTLCGLPSGGPLTVILNTLVGSMYIRIAWKLIFSSNLNFVNVNSSFQSMNKHLIFILYGDDIIASVSDEAKEYFNCETFSCLMNSYNIVVKNATKGEEIVKYRGLLDIETTFLKCNFVPHPVRHGLFLAALDKTSVEDTCNWTFKEWEHKLREISLEACDAGIRNAFGWGPDYFNYIRNSVIDYWLPKGEVIRTPLWQEIDEINYS